MKQFLSQRGPSRSTQSALCAFFFVLGVSAAALAASYAYSATLATKKSPEQVLSVLTAYGQVCDKGCKYEGPDVVEFVQLSQERSSNRWYTWSHAQNGPKHTTYFSLVSLAKESDGSFKMVTRQLDERDKGLIASLTEQTHREHGPVFDGGQTIFTVKKTATGSEVTQSIRLTGTGLITMFGKRIETGMRLGCEVTFRNIEK